MHGRDGVDVFGADAAALEVVERRGERIHAHALAVERYADGMYGELRQPGQRAVIGVALDDDRVAGRKQDAFDEIEGLQRAGGDEDLIGSAADCGGALEFCTKNSRSGR